MTQALRGYIAASPLAQSLVARWRSNPILRSVATIAGGAVFGQGLSLISAPATTRLFSPADYGIAAVFSSTVGILLLASTWRYEMAIMLPKKEEDARSVLWSSILLACAASVLSAVGLFFWGRGIFDLFKAPQLYRFWWMFPPTILGGSLYQCFSLYALRRKAYTDLSGSKIRQALSGTSTTLAVGYYCKGPIGLLLGSFCWMSMGVGRLSRGGYWLEKGVSLREVWRRALQPLRNYCKFAVLTTVSTLLASAGTLLAPILFSAFYSQTMVGHFSLAQRVIFLPCTLVGTAVAQVFMAEASDVLRTRPAELPRLFHKITRQMMPLVLGIIAVGLLCPWLFPIVFGARWKEAGIFAAILSLSAAVQMIVGPISDISILRQRLDIQMALGVLRTLVVLVSIWFPSFLGLNPMLAVASYSLGMALVSLVSFGFYERISRHTHAQPSGKLAEAPL